MLKTFIFGSTPIKYDLIYRGEISSVKITVNLEHGVEVMVPDHLPGDKLDAILRRKAPWILEKLSEFDQISQPTANKQFISGEKFLFLGRRHTLVVENSERTSEIIMRNGRFYATVKSSDEPEIVRDSLRNWYIRRAENKLPERIKRYAKQLNVTPQKIQIVQMEKRWGSCTSAGTIRLDWRLIMAPMRVIDYLVVHELGHLRVSNHSPEFWNLVETILSDFAERRDWLRVNGPLLAL